jgi:hypothetical protein
VQTRASLKLFARVCALAACGLTLAAVGCAPTRPAIVAEAHAPQNWFPLVGEMPNAHLIVYPESGYAPQHQYPELTVDHINAFLQYADQ